MYDMDTLAAHVQALKEDYPDSNQASVLLEPTIPYDYLIQVMDVVRSAEVPDLASADPTVLMLFPEISVGEAP